MIKQNIDEPHRINPIVHSLQTETLQMALFVEHGIFVQKKPQSSFGIQRNKNSFFKSVEP